MEFLKPLLALFFIFLQRGCSSSMEMQTPPLVLRYYADACPQAEDLIKKLVATASTSDPFLGSKMLRLTFHDCFVQGCDGSILLDSAGPDQKAEKDADENLTLKGFEFVDQLKLALEQECPGVVSCSDIIALAARDAVSFPFGRDLWEVPTGRRDGRVSLAEDVRSNLPSQSNNFALLKIFFDHKNLTVNDMVSLSGAHTIGLSHCTSFAYRLYNFSGTGAADPALDPAYAESLKSSCPLNSRDPGRFAVMDRTGATKFDSGYYVGVKQKKGLFESDAALLTDPTAAALVERFTNPAEFLPEFAKAMVKMTSIQVLTGSSGEIRKNCRSVN